MNVDIDTIKRKLLVKYPFFGSIIANVDITENSSFDTAATNGQIIYYNPQFISGLTEEERTFIFAHEVCHIAFDHIYRSENKDYDAWGIATDAVINALLKNDGLPLVDGVIDIPEALHYDAEEMYEIILKQKQEQEKQQQSQGNQQQGEQGQSSQSQGGQGQNNQQQSGQSQGGQGQSSQSQSGQSQNNQQQSGQGQDNPSQGGDSKEGQDQDKQPQGGGSQKAQDKAPANHEIWKEAIENKNKKSSQSETDKDQEKESSQQRGSSGNDDKNQEKDSTKQEGSSGNDDKKQDSDKQDENTKNSEKASEKQKDEKVKQLTKMGEKEAFKQNRIDRKKQLEELRDALAKQSAQAGNDSNGDKRDIRDIGVSKPLIDWRRVLREAVKLDVDWTYQNATIEYGVLTPHLEELPKPETEIVLDTSGSVDETLLKNFLRECKNIFATSKVKVGCFDTKFYGFTEVKSVYDIDNLEFRGGGGTDFNAAVNAFTNRVENKIIFTDGEASRPNEEIDAIWVVFGNLRFTPKKGKVIQISREELNRLMRGDKTYRR